MNACVVGGKSHKKQNRLGCFLKFSIYINKTLPHSHFDTLHGFKMVFLQK